MKETFENRIDRIAVAARDADGNFADGFIKRKKPFDDRAIGFVRGYDFDERIALRGEKVVRDEGALGSARIFEDALRLQVRRVGGEDAVGRRQILYLGKDALFEIQVFGRGLDDQVRIPQRFVIFGEDDVRLHRGALLGRERLRLDTFVDFPVELGPARLESLRRDIDYNDRDPFRFEHFRHMKRNIRTDLTRADDTHFLERTRT